MLLEGFDKINLLTERGRSRATLLVVLNEIACVYLRIKYNFRDIKTPLHSFTLTIPVLQAQRRVCFLIGYYSLCNTLYIEHPCFIILLLVCTIVCLLSLTFARSSGDVAFWSTLWQTLCSSSRIREVVALWNKHKVTILGTCVIDQRAITNSKLCMCLPCWKVWCEDVLAAILRQQLATFKTTSVMSSLLCLLVCSVLYFNSRVMYAQPLPFQSYVRACVCVCGGSGSSCPPFLPC